MKKIITLTAGHSNTDSGAVANGLQENQLATELRNITAGKLREKGYTVRTDGTGLINQVLQAAIALISGSDIAVEIHFNAAANKTAKGVETIALPKDKALAQKLSQEIAGVLGITVRGEKGFIDQSQSARGRLGFVSKGGLIIEVCFISNPEEMAIYQAKKWLVASAIANTLDGYLK